LEERGKGRSRGDRAFGELVTDIKNGGMEETNKEGEETVEYSKVFPSTTTAASLLQLSLACSH